jgi:hypothetical protein
MPAERKASDKPTSVKEVLDKKKLPVKKKAVSKADAKKPVKKVAKKKKPAKPPFTQAMFEKRFYSLSIDEFKALCEIYNEQQLKIKIKKQPDYDHWLNYFKTFPASHIRLLVKIGQDMLDAEAYSALRMWHDIISNPQRIAKIHQSTLSGPKAKEGQGIMAMALKNDRMGVLMATRDKLAEKLEKGAGARDTAALARELTEVMTAISDYEKRLGPKKETVLGQLLAGTPGSSVKTTEGKKRPGSNGGGRRNTSFASRVTIEDVEK